MPKILLVLQLFLAGQEPREQRVEMQDLPTCMQNAQTFLESFANKYDSAGGAAVAACFVVKEAGVPS